MLYRLRRDINSRRFNRAIAGILKTAPLVLQDAPWCIVSMVANRDVPMYLTAIKSFYPKLGKGKVAVIVDRDMPQSLRNILSDHLVGIEFVTLEDIATEPCQRGGTWERLLYCLDRSAREYTIQLDSDTLSVGQDLSEVLGCVNANRAFTMSDGFSRMTLLEAAELAQATRSNYIGIAAEAVFDRYPSAKDFHYVRGSSGFAGFAKGGYTRAAISTFHQEMEKLIGKVRWREWGTEQCGSNFAIANSPNPQVLPYPEYASFNNCPVPRSEVKLFHFIGSNRFQEGYFARRSQESIRALNCGSESPSFSNQPQRSTFGERLPLLFARNVSRGSLARYLSWQVLGRRYPIEVQVPARREFSEHPEPGPRFRLRGDNASNNDLGVAYEMFILKLLMPPLWIPPECVKLIVDLGANVGLSCLWWAANYSRAEVIAFEPHPAHAAEARSNFALNPYGTRIELRQEAVGPKAASAWISDEGSSSQLSSTVGGGFEAKVVDFFAGLSGRRIDILKIDIEGSEVGLLDDARFAALEVGAIVMEWHSPAGDGRGGKAWCIERLGEAGYRTYVTSESGQCGIVWGYRR
jgi:FkbM family methyltransferase